MKHLILIISLTVILSCCQTLSNTSNERIIHGYSYDNTTGEGLCVRSFLVVNKNE